MKVQTQIHAIALRLFDCVFWIRWRIMLFHSFRFLVFFPIVFFLYWLSPFRFRKYCLLAASYYFYMCWKAEFIVLILFSTLADYICSLQIAKNRGRRALCKIFLAVSLCVNLGLLFFFKYFNFFGETLTAFCRALSIPFSAPVLDVILPVGISFYPESVNLAF